MRERKACDLRQQEPFDFAWCRTHDTTFPLGEICPEAKPCEVCPACGKPVFISLYFAPGEWACSDPECAYAQSDDGPGGGFPLPVPKRYEINHARTGGKSPWPWRSQ